MKLGQVSQSPVEGRLETNFEHNTDRTHDASMEFLNIELTSESDVQSSFFWDQKCVSLVKDMMNGGTVAILSSPIIALWLMIMLKTPESAIQTTKTALTVSGFTVAMAGLLFGEKAKAGMLLGTGIGTSMVLTSKDVLGARDELGLLFLLGLGFGGAIGATVGGLFERTVRQLLKSKAVV